ncbi:citrulline utilization hydrolase CtlX [Sphingobacterium sp. SGL-16]|uniref:citrulline utilization hydrolase CtlX n=1 Tax=Sphingobacterium sp. SGL-16 TaxID=2710883 RepID=UPI0013EC6723|nr:arginine deiminase-related protein [Sphingobacterium sp. SGL-16]NGM72576.1 amidinotransferase [Sphingobacterium sp. SGL-16]
MAQSTNCILMVRPAAFRANEETAVNNYFQDTETTEKNTNLLAQAEFDNAVNILVNAGVKVVVVEDSGKFDTPDSIFPNNVISFHGDKAILYPMFAANRQCEIFLNHLGVLEKNGIQFKTLKDYSIYTEQELFLEGTGVLILDRVNKIAYCSISERANEILLPIFCEDNDYTPIVFHATQQVEQQRLPIYHTNVMMALGTAFCVICLDSIQNEEERKEIITNLEATNKSIISISEKQMHHFCGNILELKNKEEETLIVLSEQAFNAFSEEQKEQLRSFGKLISIPIYTIEKYGGGSIRCMIAEVFH